jgi:hypothetical protein
LLHVVGALDSAGSLASGLYRGQEERDQNSDNRDHDQQFNQSKPAATHSSGHRRQAPIFGSG